MLRASAVGDGATVGFLRLMGESRYPVPCGIVGVVIIFREGVSGSYQNSLHGSTKMLMIDASNVDVRCRVIRGMTRTIR